MQKLLKIVASHPIQKDPYRAIKFARIDGQGTPLYTVAKDAREFGAKEALRLAFEKLGGHCFHCKTWMPPQPLSLDCTRDHIRPKSNGGQNYLHNLVLACGPCNRKKGRDNLISFQPTTASEYLDALEAHLTRCIKNLRC